MAKKGKPASAIIGDVRMELTSTDGNPIIMFADVVPDKLATKIGQLVVRWGQFQHDLLNFTKNLLEYNSTQDAPNIRQLQRLLDVFEMESKLAFDGHPTLLGLAGDVKTAADRSKTLRHRLAHNPIDIVLPIGSEVEIRTYFTTRAGEDKSFDYSIPQIESTHKEICWGHGQLLILALGTSRPPRCTHSEQSLLQAVSDKGYYRHPMS